MEAIWHTLLSLAAAVALLQSIVSIGMAQDGWPLITRQPYVQMVTHDSAVIVWRTERPIFPIVRYGDALDDMNETVAPNQIVQRVSSFEDAPPDIPRLHGADPGTHQYEARIRGLRPDRTYFYSISDFLTPALGGDDRHHFRTAPDPGNDDRPSRFWVVGDSGDGSIGQYESYRGFQRYIESEPATMRKRVDAYIHLGDMAYNLGEDGEFSAYFFGFYADLLRTTCCWPTMGNHEGANSSGITGIGPYYDAYVLPTRGEAGGVPSGTEAYYAFDYGNIHFICLNSHDLDRTPAGAMAEWLKSDLEEANAEWLIAFWHHPPYTKGTHDSDRELQSIELRRYIMPILESAGVDLVLTGHSHTYERSMLIDGAYSTPTTVDDVVLDDGDGAPSGDGAYRKNPSLNPNEGSVSVVAGHGRFALQYYGESPVMRRTIPVIGSFVLDVDDRVLTGRMIDGFGAVRDEFQITKESTVQPPVRVADPWRPSGPSLIVTERTPGARTMEMFPVPRASDAVVRYEFNGDEVTEASPIYTSPIPLAKTDRLVQAKSYWRNGTRDSPLSTAVVSSSSSAPQLQNLVIPISTPADDAVEATTGLVSADGNRLFLGNFDQSTTGLRFTHVGIDPGATVYSAYIDFHSTVGSFSPTELNVYLEKSADALEYDERIVSDITARDYHEEFVRWIPATWSYNQRYSNQKTPNFASVLQKHITQSNWQAGNALAIAISGSGSRDAWSFDYEPELAARLYITFDTRGPLEVAIDQPFLVQPTPYKHFNGPLTDGVRIQHRRFSSNPPGHELTYSIEFSTILAEGSWMPLPDSELVKRFEAILEPWRGITLNLPLSLLGDSPEYFFRVKITESARVE
ncbi:MAG: metallophosphoesterase [Verrucomicrobiae bacterium]|nr:metallophosphoesterase [Verrucomicrobiae bacterium]